MTEALIAFPPGFIWGAATASYQIEGAPQADGKVESIWDRFAHTPGKISNGDTGDIACDHYHRYQEDVDLMRQLGLAAYRFSVSWPRIRRDDGTVNQAGLDFYDRLVDELLGAGIEPFVTLYHWDLPQALEEAGGWPERAIVEEFVDYARVVVGRLGDRVTRFATLNEPFVVADLGYRQGVHAPGRRDPAAAVAAAHHLLLAHGRAVAAMRSIASVEAGIVLNFEAKTPASEHPLDLEAALLEHDFANRWFLDPITGHGYPTEGSRARGWRVEQVAADLEEIAAPLDFLGINYYTRSVVRSPRLSPLLTVPAEVTGMGWEVYPQGLTDLMQFVASRTGEVPLYITENGAAYPLNEAHPASDPDRTSFLRRHVEAAHQAVAAGVPLRGYFAWSLLDNFEWAHGYSQRFGLVHVNFDTQERIVRDSGRLWSELARSNRLPAAG
ncbi:MAG TPA: GH1 family beta-glucosidase [Acidimicrobiia bacterium]|nr:GH1 family beta-glucosidase [Acidimicrobiia bacterium]